VDRSFRYVNKYQYQYFISIRCLSHQNCLTPGTKGSLESFLTNKNASDEIVSELNAVMLGIRTLSTVEEFKIAVTLLQHYMLMNEKYDVITHNESTYNHLISAYFSPTYGPVHNIMDVESTNGLESRWEELQTNINVFIQITSSSLVEAALRSIIEKSALSKWGSEKLVFHVQPLQTFEEWEYIRNYKFRLPANIQHAVYYKGGKCMHTDELVSLLSAKAADRSKITIYVPHQIILAEIYQEIVQSLSTEQITNKNVKEFLQGLTMSTEVLSNVQKQVSQLLHEETTDLLEDVNENVFEYLRRRGQRQPSGVKFVKELLDASKMKTHKRNYSSQLTKELEQGTNTDKWQEQEKIGTDKKTSTIEIKINPLPPTIPLGRFKRVTLIKKESDCVLDAVNDGYQLRCSCEKFRKHGSCDETKFFGVIFLNRLAPSECKPPLFEGMKKEKMSMIEQIQKTTSSFDSVKATSSPSIDPWRLK